MGLVGESDDYVIVDIASFYSLIWDLSIRSSKLWRNNLNIFLFPYMGFHLFNRFRCLLKPLVLSIPLYGIPNPVPNPKESPFWPNLSIPLYGISMVTMDSRCIVNRTHLSIPLYGIPLPTAPAYCVSSVMTYFLFPYMGLNRELRVQ